MYFPAYTGILSQKVPCSEYVTCSNTARGRLKKEEGVPEYHIIEDEIPRGLNRSWARLIQKVYEVDPLICPRCGGDMMIVAFINYIKIGG